MPAPTSVDAEIMASKLASDPEATSASDAYFSPRPFTKRPKISFVTTEVTIMMIVTNVYSGNVGTKIFFTDSRKEAAPAAKTISAIRSVLKYSIRP